MRERMERFDKYMKYKGINDNQVTLNCNLSQGLIGQARTGKSDLGNRTVDKILKVYQDLSRVWLLTGEGQMLTESPPEIQKTSPDEYTHASEEKLKQIPILPISAQGGSLNDFTLSVRKYDCEWMSSPIFNADFAIEVAGDSMAPEYSAGARVLIKRINESAFIEWGKVYVIDTENGVVLKKVVPADDDTNIRCVSINPHPNYAPFNIPKTSIYGMYIVLGLYAKK